MEERNGAHEFLDTTLSCGKPRINLGRICQQIAVRQHCRLGQPRRATGILQYRHIIGMHMHRRRHGWVFFDEMLKKENIVLTLYFDPRRITALLGPHQLA